MDTLSLGKEAAYRRIRGDVSFSFEEISIISQQLNLSVDKVLNISNPDKGDFTLNVSLEANPLESFLNNVNKYVRIFRSMSTCIRSLSVSAHNSLPYSWYFSRELLSRFMLYKWMCQRELFLENTPFSKFVLPEEVMAAQKAYMDKFKKIRKTTFILEKGIFSSLARDVAFLAQLDLLSPAETWQVKREFLAMLDDMEDIAEVGTWKKAPDTEVRFYLSEVDFDNTYIYLECDALRMASLRIFSLESIFSQNNKVCSMQKDWIESLMQHSTLISQSATMQRIEYFKEQRKWVDSII